MEGMKMEKFGIHRLEGFGGMFFIGRPFVRTGETEQAVTPEHGRIFWMPNGAILDEYEIATGPVNWWQGFKPVKKYRTEGHAKCAMTRLGLR